MIEPNCKYRNNFSWWIFPSVGLVHPTVLKKACHEPLIGIFILKIMGELAEDRDTYTQFLRLHLEPRGSEYYKK